MKWLIYKAFVFTFFLAAAALAQDPAGSFPEKAGEALARLNEERPGEKIYIHFDKPYYAAGDRIWFRLYLVDASTHVPGGLSELAYVELISPADTLVKRLVLQKDKGHFNGSFDLPDSMPEGNYRIRAYTSWMRNSGEEFFFRKAVPIGNSRLSNVETHIEYDVDRTKDPPAITANIRFTDEEGDPVAGREVEHEVILIGRHGTRDVSGTDSTGSVSIPVPYNESALYPNKHIRVSINYDGQPLVKNFFLPSFKEETDLQFFPEGGDLVAGVPNIVAFKATGADGLGRDVSGEIRDAGGKRVASFRSTHRGMGKLVFIPEAGMRYSARLTHPEGAEGEYELPPVQEEGYLLHIDPADSLIRVRIAASSARLRNRPVFLIAQTRSVIRYAAQAVLEKPLYQAVIPKSRFPSGVTQFTLFDADSRPVAERLVFVNNNDRPVVRIVADRREYGAREEVEMRIAVTDTAGKPVSGQFSVSVTDRSVVNWENQPGILESLLLTSDLQGYVEDPAFYFGTNAEAGETKEGEETNEAAGIKRAAEMPGSAGMKNASGIKEAAEALDLLMLTQGWRRFRWDDVLAGKFPEITYPAETGLEITGKVTGSSGDALPNAQVVLLAGNRKEGFALEDTADAAGKFRFSGYDFPDSTRVLIQARNEKGRREGDIEIIADRPPIHQTPERFPPNVNGRMKDYLARSKEIFSIEREALGLSSILLAPVYVTAEKAPRSTGLHTYANHVISAEDISRMGAPINIYEVLRGRVPGVMVLGNRVIIRGISTFYGNTDPLVVVDGVRSMDASILGMINPLDVESIEILKGPNAAIYGLGAANGVIVINTKRGEYQPRGAYERRGIVSFFPDGYHVAKEFYMPRYEVPRNLRDKTPDLRSTIYWNGNVRINSEGVAKLHFYTADRPAAYTVIVEGLSDQGGIGRGQSLIRREP